jgi:large subunit ribosomal protein L24
VNKIRKGDEVIAITGKDKGKRGSVVRVLEGAVLVQGINVVKKHQKPNPVRGEVGGIIDREMPIDISNIALFNPATQKGDRVGIRTLEDGRRVRFFKSNGEVIDA